MHVAIYASKDPSGKAFLVALKRRIEAQEIRAWEIRRNEPLTLVHAGERYVRARVSFVPAGSRKFARTTKAGTLGAFSNPQPALIAVISEGPSADRVLGFLVGMLTRHAGPLGVAGVGIPLEASRT